jgi:hypothetical protein
MILRVPRNWARLIQKIYEVDPLTCPKCQGRMKIISFIEDEEVIEKILKHLGLWNVKARPPPEVKVPPVRTKMDHSDSQVSSYEWFYPHPDYPVDSYMRSRLNRAFYSTFQSIILTSKPYPKVKSR